MKNKSSTFWKKEIPIIKKLVLEGYGVKELAERYGCTFQRISQICYLNNVSIRDIKEVLSDERAKLKLQKLQQIRIKRKIHRKDNFFVKWSDISNYVPKYRFYPLAPTEGVDPKLLKARKLTREYNKRNYIKALARRVCGLAIKRSYLNPQPCIFCGTIHSIEAHHKDYTRPLDVTWVCKKHHNEYFHRGKGWKKDRKIG